MKRILLLFVIAITTSVGFSQENDKGKIDPQRPTLTESYSIIVPNTLQFENGMDLMFTSGTSQFGTFIRGSVSKNIELRTSTDYVHLTSAGAKFVVMDPVNSTIGTGTSFIFNRDILNNSNDYRVAMSKDFKSLFITYNFGYNETIYNILLLGIPIKDDFNYFTEYYIDHQMNRVHGGFTWILQRDLQLDINGGWIDANSWYLGFGVSFRLR